jgi:hypothetical protein
MIEEIEAVKIIIALLTLVMVFASFGCAQKNTPLPQTSQAGSVGLVSNADKAPAVGSPSVQILPNGDREGRYPPYHYPDGHL